MIYSTEILTTLTTESKSQIAIEYAYRLRKRSPTKSVFWVHANNAVRFEQSYRNIATTVKIPGIEDPKVDVLNLVFQWLDSGESGDWLLILDNADDADMFFSPLVIPTAREHATDIEPPYLSRFLPETGSGSTLITSRDEGTALRLTGERKQVLRVDVMSEDDAVALLTKGLPEDASDESAKKGLIDELDSIPLAITQASAYINTQGTRMTIAKYLELLRRDEKSQIHLLSKDEADLRRDPGVPNSVIRTWQISFSQIKDQNPAAADLLSCMCMLDRQGIPEFLFHEDGDQSLEFDEAIGILIRFSFVIEGKEQGGFEIHRLVQLATRKWIETFGEIQRVQEEALRLISQHYPDGEYRNWTICEALEPHAQIVLNYFFDSKDCKLQQKSLLHNGAWFALRRGRFNISEERVKRAIDIGKAYLKPDDQSTLASIHLLAWTYQAQGKWKEAEELDLQVLEARERIFGAKHPETMISMGSLAMTYRNQGRWAEAEKLFLQVLETQKKVLGDKDPHTLTLKSNLATLYKDQGRQAEAEKLNLQVLETQKVVLGDKHPDTLLSMSNIAAIYRGQGRWTEAEELSLQVLETQKAVLGDEHPHTITSINNLAMLYDQRGERGETAKARALPEVGAFTSDPLGGTSTGDDISSADSSYPESIFSAASVAYSSSTYSAVLQSAAEELEELLANDEVLKPLYKTAFQNQKIGVERFQRNFRRLLKIYSRDLRDDADEDDQRSAARLVYTQATYVTDRIRKRYDPVYHDEEEEMRKLKFQTTGRARQERLEQYLQHAQRPESILELEDLDSPPLHNEAESHEAAALLTDDDDQESEDGSERRDLPNLTDVKEFLVRSYAFKNLCSSFQQFVQPERKDPTKIDTALNIHNPEAREEKLRSFKIIKDHFWIFSPNLPNYLFRKLRSEWKKFREPPLEEHKIRIRWTCQCGDRLWDDFKELQPGAAENLQKELEFHERAGLKASPAPHAQAHNPNTAQSASTSHELYSMSSPETGTSSSVNIPTGNLLDSRTSTRNRTNVGPPSNPQDFDKKFLLLCFGKSNDTPRLLQLNLMGITSDAKLFRLLQDTYANHRGTFSRAFRTITSINFRKLERHPRERVVILSNAKILPQRVNPDACHTDHSLCDTIYDIQPTPPDLDPYIGRNGLVHLLRYPHEAEEEGNNLPQQTVWLKRFPKKEKTKLTVCPPYQYGIGWGIEFEEGWHGRC